LAPEDLTGFALSEDVTRNDLGDIFGEQLVALCGAMAEISREQVFEVGCGSVSPHGFAK
jgi:hypothetical protein